MNEINRKQVLLISAWAQLGLYDIRSKYRRTFIGPLWISLSTGLSVGFLGFVYGSLFNAQWKIYLPYVTAGMISWTLISTIITEGSLALINYKHVFHSFPINPILPVVRILVKANMIFLHNIIVFFMVAYLCDIEININQFLIFPGLAIHLINGLWVGLLLSLICSRYRDVGPLINAVIGVLFLITPVLWFPEMLADSRRYIANYNPFTHYIAIIRQPMLGNIPEAISWYFVVFFTLFGCIVTMAIYRSIRNRVIYWL
jgi:ABC-type polysaccharide/polyol phosphate export permease